MATLGTVTGAGAPHLVPVTFAVLGAEVCFAIDHKPKRTRDLARLRNIAANPAVSFLADRYSDDWDQLWWVRADGHATVLDEYPEALDALRHIRVIADPVLDADGRLITVRGAYEDISAQHWTEVTGAGIAAVRRGGQRARWWRARRRRRGWLATRREVVGGSHPRLGGHHRRVAQPGDRLGRRRQPIQREDLGVPGDLAGYRADGNCQIKVTGEPKCKLFAMADSCVNDWLPRSLTSLEQLPKACLCRPAARATRHPARRLVAIGGERCPRTAVRDFWCGASRFDSGRAVLARALSALRDVAHVECGEGVLARQFGGTGRGLAALVASV